MSTPTDPYNSGSRRPFDDDDSILDPLEDNEGSTADDDQAAWDRAFNSDQTFNEDDLDSTDEPGQESEFGSAGDAADTEREVVLDDEIADGDRERAFGDARNADAAGDDNPTLGGFVTGRNGDQARERAGNDLDDPATDPDRDLDNADHELDVDEPRNGPTRTSVMGATEPTAAPSTQSPADVPADDTHENRAFMTSEDAVERRERWAADPGEDTLAVDIPDEPKGRGLTHVGVLLLTLLLVPVAWYLISDAGARLSTVADNPWDTGTVQVMPLLELLGGIAVLAVIWLMARASSLGAQAIGAIVALAGAAALIVPTYGNDVVEALDNAIGGYNDFTGNVIYHLGNDLGSGRVATFGVLLLLTGLVAHGARRRGKQVATAITRRHFLLGDQSTKKD